MTAPQVPGDSKEGQGRCGALAPDMLRRYGPTCTLAPHNDGEHGNGTVSWHTCPAPSSAAPVTGEEGRGRAKWADLYGLDPAFTPMLDHPSSAAPVTGDAQDDGPPVRCCGICEDDCDCEDTWTCLDEWRSRAQDAEHNLSLAARAQEDECPACARGEGPEGWHYPACADAATSKPGDAQRALLDAADAIEAEARAIAGRFRDWPGRSKRSRSRALRAGHGVAAALVIADNLRARAAAVTGSPDTGEGDTP